MPHKDAVQFPDGRVPQLLDLRELAEAMGCLTGRVTELDGQRALDELVTITIERVPAARWASMTFLRGQHFTTPAATHEGAVQADLLQYQVGSGPCVDAVRENAMYVTGDVARDQRWTQWGERVNAELGVNSVMAQRLHLHDEAKTIAGLNVYSDESDAFDDAAQSIGLVLATHAALVVTAMQAHEQSANLRLALESNREIGVAMGVLMTQHHLTRVQAFDLLRAASQHTNRKLATIATEVADTGTLTFPSSTPAGAGPWDQVSSSDVGQARSALADPALG